MSTSFTTSELADLLGRTARARVGVEERAAFANRRVLVTGAAGSIGSALACTLASLGPEVVALVDQSELGLFTLERELSVRWPTVRVEAFLTDVTHAPSMSRAIGRVRPDVVYHAAAYKHVTMTERAPSAAARVNVQGSVVAAAAAAKWGARFVLISSDKAADPMSVMGATKRVAEMATLSLASSTFRPIVVRFGNVIGSSGSVVPLMRDAIRAGRPVAVTDPDATRYFMTAAEAVALVLRADILGRAAEIFWLDMGEPVRIGDLVTRLIELEARLGYGPAAIDVIGLRPGEKRTETLADPGLTFQRTIDARILVARERRHSRIDVLAGVRRLTQAARVDRDDAVVEALRALLPAFQPSAQAREAAAQAAETARRPRSARTRRARPAA